MGSIRRAHRQLIRCVSSSRLVFDEAESPSGSPSSTPSLRTIKLKEKSGSPRVVGQVAAESSQTADKAVGARERQFWQEIFSALSMLVPSVYAYMVCPAAVAQYGAFRPGVYALVYSTYVHCAASFWYHLHNAMRDGDPGFDPYLSPYRILDLVAIHFCCVTFGWAVSHGAVIFTVVSTLLNLGYVNRLVSAFLKGSGGNPGDGIRVGIAILLYTSPILLRGDLGNYLGAVFWFGLAGAAWFLAPMCNGWTHGIFHLLLAPYFHFLLRSASGVTGTASFLL